MRLFFFAVSVCEVSCFALCSPPRVPPRPPPIVMWDGEGEWNFVQLDIETAERYLSQFWNSHAENDSDPDFSLEPCVVSPFRQGTLGFRKGTDVRLIAKYTEEEEGVALVSEVAVPYGDYEACVEFGKTLRYCSDVLRIDRGSMRQMKWLYCDMASSFDEPPLQ